MENGVMSLNTAVFTALVATGGSFLGLILKEFVLVKYFDNLKEKRAVRSLFKKYNDPLLLSAMELSRRLSELLSRGNYSAFVSSFTTYNFNLTPKNQTRRGSNDPYFLKYKIVSTMYRFCSFFGWLELYRQELTFLGGHTTKRTKKILRIIEVIRTQLADGYLIEERADWPNWHDVLIFREELRAIGEAMIETKDDRKSILGYLRFQELIVNGQLVDNYLWMQPVVGLFLDFRTEKDFRKSRLRFMLTGLVDLIQVLNNDIYEQESKKLRLVKGGKPFKRL